MMKNQKLKFPIGYKLLASGLIVLLFIVLMIVASQVVGKLFKDTSHELVIEYNELEAVQELKFSISQFLLPLSSYAIYGKKSDEDYFKMLIHKAEDDLKLCEKVLTSSHDLELLSEFKTTIRRVDSLGTFFFQFNKEKNQAEMDLFLGKINNEVETGIKRVDLLLAETKEEIGEYLSFNNTVIKHSTITILTIGLIVALIILVGGWLFIRSLIQPINELVTTTNRISEGDRSAKVKVNTNDEFQILADSFNDMVDRLEETTVSRNYLDNVLKNMFDSLVVTDNQLKIRSVNKATSELLGYDKSELIEKEIAALFDKDVGEKEPEYFSELDFERQAFEINNMDYLLSKSGKRIAVLLSCSTLKNQNDETDGLIIVAHDLTEKKAIEEKLDHSRKQRLIDINEAQEEERMRIATDLHDGLGQMLTAISYSVQDLSPGGSKGNPIVNEPVTKIQEQIDRAIRETKNLAHNLIPIVLKDFGLIVAIENLISRANELYETKFRVDTFDFNDRIDPKREKVIYRICQESLNNIIKHARAHNATYQIFWQDCSVVLVIEDDGVGFDIDEIKEKKTGVGLISMRERVLAFDGNFTINSEPGKGTEIIAEIPCQL